MNMGISPIFSSERASVSPTSLVLGGSHRNESEVALF
jgi:hypothetical protein